MSIRFKQNFIVAKKVLAQLNKIISKEVAKECSVEAYSNCREQGFSIVKYQNPSCLRVSFSENRNSDDIVVYAGKDCEFQIRGNIPNEEIYKQAKYFRYDKITEAAQFIANYFSNL